MTPDDKELARCIHETAKNLGALLEQVTLKYPGKSGEQWANWYLEVTRKLVEETSAINRGEIEKTLSNPD